MFVERRINHAAGSVELWQCDWEMQAGRPTRKVFVRMIGEEQPVRPPEGSVVESAAICWSYGRTLGNIAVFSPSLLGSFPDKRGGDAILPCDFVDAGKFRHGASRWWCRTHQSHWGTKADYEAYERLDVMVCGNHEQPMNYVVKPFRLKVDDYAEVGIWCSMPAAISTLEIKPRPPRIHVHVRPDLGGKKSIDGDFEAIAIEYGQHLGLFENPDITQVNITPPAAYQFVRSLEIGQETDCISCSHCGYPHLDLGTFAERPHRKHFCANCGRDSTWSSGPIISTPLRPLHDQFTTNAGFQVPNREVDLDKLRGCNYTLWASTPAIVWTANRPQEKGIHVHVHDGSKRIVDDTYGKVILGAHELVREELLTMMVQRTVI
jgi:hypothetical protein